MTDLMINSRKRLRSKSSEQPYDIQSKHFINQQIMNERDKNKMKTIHDRTIRMLFRNAKDLHNNNVGAAIVDKLDYFRSVRLIGNGTVHLLNGQQLPKEPVRACNYCQKPSFVPAIDCVNCNLELCESCGVSCSRCNEPLCLACVELFGCNGLNGELSCCQRCKLLNFN